MHALSTVGHEHHAALMPRVDDLARLADELDAPGPDFSARLVDDYRFITGQLVPHMETAETTLYPELERLMQNRHAMTPMRREHIQLRGLIDELGSMVDHELTFGTRLRLRRVLYRMYAILKIHLAEEEAYWGVLDHSLSSDEQQALARSMEHAMAGTPV